jgi:hypothetical protein
VYILLFLGPVHGEVVYSESLPEVGDVSGDGVDDMCNFIADDELNIL